MYEDLKPRALEIIKEAKKQNEFVATQIKKELEETFENVPSAQTIRNRAKQINSDIEDIPKKDGRDEYLTVEDRDWNELEVESPVIKTAEELCEERWIDLSKWRMEKIVVWNHNVAIKDDFKEKIISVRSPNMKVTLKRDYTQEDKVSALEAIEKAGSQNFKDVEYNLENDKEFAVINPADLHLWKIAYKFISWDNYDISTAKKNLREKLGETLAKLEQGGFPSELLFVIGNDWLNIDSPSQATTSWTPQDNDWMYKNAKNELISLRLEVIERLKTKAPIKVINVAGNHDEETSISIYNMLRACYNNSDNVSFNTEQSFEEQPISNTQQRQAIKKGNTLLAFNHGDKYTSNTKRKQIPNDVRTRYSHMIDKNTNIYVMLWHLHKKIKQQEQVVNQMNGVTVFWLPSLSGVDKRHDNNNYVGNPKALETFVFHKDKWYSQSIMATVK